MEEDDVAAQVAAWEITREKIAAAPVVGIRGVVEPGGIGCSIWAPHTLWQLTINLEAWRVDGVMETQRLGLHHEIPEEEISRWQEAIRPYEVIHVRARIERESPLGHPYGNLVEFVGVDKTDDELNRFSQELQNPVTFEDAILGRFILNRTVNWYEGTANWEGKPISIALSAVQPDDLKAALKTAHTLWKRTLTSSPTKWKRRVEETAIRYLLDLKNDVWLGDGETELTAQQFISRMTLESITVYPDGSFTFWHDDGGLFFGHSIQISGNLTEGPNFADIPG